MFVIALRLPYGRNRNHIRRCIRPKKILRQIVHALIVAEIPFPIEQKNAVRLLLLFLQRSFLAAKRDIVSTIGQCVHMKTLNILIGIGQIHLSFLPVCMRYLLVLSYHISSRTYTRFWLRIFSTSSLHTDRFLVFFLRIAIISGGSLG